MSVKLSAKGEKHDLVDVLSRLGAGGKSDAEESEELCCLRKEFENKVLIPAGMKKSATEKQK